METVITYWSMHGERRFYRITPEGMSNIRKEERDPLPLTREEKAFEGANPKPQEAWVEWENREWARGSKLIAAKQKAARERRELEARLEAKKKKRKKRG